MKTSKVRIIGGSHKRRYIEFLPVNGLRPTPDRVRETVFNWLMPFLYDAHVLDLCAGSGAFGFECVSRGAAQAVLVEPNKMQFACLKKTVDILSFDDRISLYNQKAETLLAQTQFAKAFDIIFIDPPYSLNLWDELLQRVFDNQLVHKESCIYLEADKPHETLSINDSLQNKLTLLKTNKAGQIYSGLYRVSA